MAKVGHVRLKSDQSTRKIIADCLTDVTMLCSFTALSTVASIIQQFHYAFAWEVIKQAQFDKAVQSLTTPALGLGGAAQTMDVVLFDIREYSWCS